MHPSELPSFKISTQRLEQMLASRRPSAVSEALDALELAPSGALAHLPALLQVAGDPSAFAADFERATSLLLSQGGELVPELLRRLESPDDDCAYAVLRCLHLLHTRSAPAGVPVELDSKALAKVTAALPRIERRHAGAFGYAPLNALIEDWRRSLSAVALPLALANAQVAQAVRLTSSNERMPECIRGHEILREGGTLLLLVSAGSSRFNQPRMQKLLSWAMQSSPQVLLAATAELAWINRKALGESDQQALSYCQKKRDQIRGYAASALDDPQANCRLFPWQKVLQSPRFSQEYQYLAALYCVSDMRRDLDAQAGAVLRREQGTEPTAEQLRVAVDYSLIEIAAVCAAPEVLGCGPIVLPYCGPSPGLQKTLRGEYDGRPRYDVGYITYEIEETEQD